MRLSGNRWFFLSLYLVSLIFSQFYWFNFAPLTSFLMQRYRIGALAAGWTILVFSISNLLLSSHAGMVIDRHGYRFSLRVGLVMLAFGAWLRVFANRYWLLLLGQIAIAVAVPYIWTCTAKIVSRLFNDGARVNASSLCAVATCIGSSSSLALSPLLILDWGFRPAMVLLALVATLWAAAFWLLAGGEPWLNALTTEEVAGGNQRDRSLLLSRNLLVLYAIGFLGQGLFTSITTWVELLWHHFHFSSKAGGLASSFLIIGGIGGGLAMPWIAKVLRGARLQLMTTFFSAAACIYPFLWASSPGRGYMWAGLLGFFLLAGLPILYAELSRAAPAHLVGTVFGRYVAVSSLGGFTIAVSFNRLQERFGWRPATFALVGLAGCIGLIAGLLYEEGGQTTDSEVTAALAVQGCPVD